MTDLPRPLPATSRALPARTRGSPAAVLAAALTATLATAPAVAAAVTVSNAGRTAFAPDVATGPDGSLNVVWLERTPTAPGTEPGGTTGTDAWFARSTDRGRSFTAPVRVNAVPGSVWGFPASRPRIQAGRGTVHVWYAGQAEDPASGASIVVPAYARSTDGGASFAPPIVPGGLPSGVRADDPANGELFGTLVLTGDGGLLAAWIDLRGVAPGSAGGRILAARSGDAGQSFGAPVPIVPADACPCCQPTAVAAGDRVVLGFRLAAGDGYRDSAIAVSTDGGRTFGAPVRSAAPRWAIDACPLKPTALALAGRRVVAAAFTGGAEPAGVMVSRTGRWGGGFRGAQPLHAGAAVSDAPALAVVGDRVVAAWHAKAGPERRVFVATSRDTGRSFGPPRAAPASAPAGPGGYPALAGRADGLLLAWQQGDAITTRFIPAGDRLLR